MKKYFKYILCFIIPIIIFCYCLLLNKFAPFGDYLITIYDSKLQYPGFFTALKNFNMFSFNVGLGFNFLGTFTYYLMNPLNHLIHFFSLENYNTFYLTLILIKIGLCGITMHYFLAHEEKNDKLWSVIFSIIYALIGFVATYYYNVFWIDGIFMLPLVLHGINNIIKGKSSKFYLLSLTISIILSFYTGYMTCIFSVIYFIYKLIETNNYKNKKIIIRFIITSLISGLISCIVILPAFYALMSGKANGYNDTFTKYFEFNENIKYLFYSFIPGNYDSSQVSYGFGQNFCTLFCLSLFFTSFFNKSISKKTKITTLIIFILYLVSYSFNLFDFAWQFFQKPVWWQHRYSFTLSCFIIIVAYKNLMSFKNLDISNILRFIIFTILTALIVISFILFYFSINNPDKYRLFIIIFSILLLFNYIFLFNSQTKKYKVIIIFFIFCELFLNTFISTKENNNKSTLTYDTITKETITNNINKIKKLDKSFYRMELIESYTSNDGLLFNYNGINYFNSLRNQNVINLAEYYLNMLVDSHCSMKLKSFDPYLMSLLNIKYLVGNTDIYYYEEIENDVFENKYSLSLAFLVDDQIKNVKLEKNEFHNNIEKIFGSMINEKIDLYYELDDKQITLDNAIYDEKNKTYNKIDFKKGATAIIEFVAKENMFIIPQYSNVKTFAKVYINDKEVTLNSSYLFVNKDDEVRFENQFVQNNEQESITRFIYLKESDYLQIMSTLSNDISKSISNIKVNKEHLLSITVNKEKVNTNFLFTTIPYEKGMIIKVNNKKVEPELVFDTFIGLDLEDNENIITIDYIPKGIKEGVIISIIGFTLAWMYIKKQTKENN